MKLKFTLRFEVQRHITSCCSPGMFVYQWGSLKPRFVIDYQCLNHSIKIPHWHFLSSDQVRKSQPERTDFLISMDLEMGFHQLYHPTESSNIPTFSCQIRRFRWKNYPQGLCSSRYICMILNVY